VPSASGFCLGAGRRQAAPALTFPAYTRATRTHLFFFFFFFFFFFPIVGFSVLRVCLYLLLLSWLRRWDVSRLFAAPAGCRAYHAFARTAGARRRRAAALSGGAFPCWQRSCRARGGPAARTIWRICAFTGAVRATTRYNAPTALMARAGSVPCATLRRFAMLPAWLAAGVCVSLFDICQAWCWRCCLLSARF